MTAALVSNFTRIKWKLVMDSKLYSLPVNADVLVIAGVARELERVHTSIHIHFFNLSVLCDAGGRK